MAAKLGIWAKDLEPAFPVATEIPFSSSRKMMAIVCGQCGTHPSFNFWCVALSLTGINQRRSSDLTSAYALLVEPTEKYINQKTHPQKHFVPGF